MKAEHMIDDGTRSCISIGSGYKNGSLDQYYLALQEIVNIALKQDIDIQSLIYNPGDHKVTVQDAISLRKKFVNRTDVEKYQGYLEFDYFGDNSEDSKVASWSVLFEASDEMKKVLYRRDCEAYNSGHPLFRGDPGLFKHIRKKETSRRPDFELIDLSQISFSSYPGEVVGTNMGFARLSSHLDPRIVRVSKERWPSAKTYVRLDPYFFSKCEPMANLQEDTIVPANPKWFSKDNLRNGDRDYGHYVLADNPCTPENAHAFLEFNSRGVRSLEFHAQRSKDDYLSMMLEELPRPDDSSGLMVGRCIHLDTQDPVKTPPKDAIVQHLDLAINVYEGVDRQSRLDNNLQHGRSADASFRIHLFRIEDIPFYSIFDICYMFFESKCLLKEMMNDLGVDVLEGVSDLKCG